MGDTPIRCNVWTTAVASVDLEGPTASSATIKIGPGYVAGCQIDIGTLSPNENAGEQQWNDIGRPQ
ncbi:MspA family porin [Nocardia niigatensis]